MVSRKPKMEKYPTRQRAWPPCEHWFETLVPGSSSGFPAMTERVAFLMKDLVIFAASFCLLKEDVVRASVLAKPMREQNRQAA